MSDIVTKTSFGSGDGIFVTDETNKSFAYETGDGTVIHVQSGSTRYDRKTTVKICSDTNNINAAIQFETESDFLKFCDLLNNLK